MSNNSFLAHHGVKGQKWGVRRYQNYDGSLTYEGRKHRMYRDRTIKAGKTQKDVQSIVDSFSDDEIRRLGMDPSHREYMTYAEGSHVVHRIIKYDGDIPVAFFDLLEDENDINTVIGTRSGDEYRGKGYAKQCAKEGMEWFEKNKNNFDYNHIYWGVRTDNEQSIKIAKDLGFKGTPGRKRRFSDGEVWGTYYKDAKPDTVFVSGSSKTQNKDSPYHRDSLPTEIQQTLDNYMASNKRIAVGDAPGIDRQVQDYLHSKNYKNVDVYGPGKEVRYSANKSWRTKPIDSDYEKGSKEWLAEKDKVMSEVATEGLAIVLPDGSKATRKNIDRLLAENKDVKIYELNMNTDEDRWR